MANVFVNTARCNQGGFQITTYGAQQVAHAIATLGFSSYYIFNGSVDAYSAGVAFASSAIPSFIVGKSAILIDCEDEGVTGTAAWGPDQAIAFANGVRAVRPDIPTSSFIVYMNYTVNRRFNWQACVDAGMGFCYARPGGPDDYLWWPSSYARYIKQDGTVNGIDADWHNSPWSTVIGSAPISQPTEEDVALVQAKDRPGQPIFLFAPGYVKHLATGDQVSAAQYTTRLGQPNYSSDQEFQDTIWNYGLEEYTVDQVLEIATNRNPDGSVKDYNKGGMLIASWNDARKASIQVDDAQVKQIAAQIAADVSVGASQEQVQAAITAAFKSLVLKAA
jgi:hypothetical protein